MFVLAGTASIGAAQDIGVLNQRFQLRYNSWRLNQEPATSATQAVYDFSAGLPVMSYRLGAVALSGSMEYNRLSTGESSGSDLGLNRYGVRVYLFPYRPFHLNLEYSHSQTPGLLGAEKVKGNIVGAALNYRGHTVQDMQLSFRRGTSTQPGESEAWTQVAFAANQRFGMTTVTLSAAHQDFEGSGGATVWKSTTLSAGTDTAISQQWKLRTSLTSEDIAEARSIGVGADLVGNLGPWVSLTSMSMRQSDNQGDQARSVLASESAVLSQARFSVFGTVALSKVSASSGGSGAAPNTETIQVGGAYALSSEWRVSGDVGLSSGGASATGGATGAHETTAIHGGFSRGGDIPALIKHSLFYLSDLSFQRQVSSDYPPDYVPSELAEQMMQRRLRQNGGFGFTGDFWHIHDKGDGGKLDWARITGDLRVGDRIRIFAIGDWKLDDGMAVQGQRGENRAISLNGSFRFDVSSISAAAGYFKNALNLKPIESSGVTLESSVAAAGTPDDHAATYYSMGFNSRAWKVPYGLLLTRYDEGQHLPTTSLSSFAMLNFRHVSLRVSYQTARRPDGFRSSRITVDLLRLFDSIALWGQKW